MIVIRQAHKKDLEKLQLLDDEVFIDNQKYDLDLDMNWAKSEKGKKILFRSFKRLKLLLFTCGR